MRYVIYTDKQGYRRRSLVRDTDTDDKAELGIPANPPDVNEIDCGFLMREINNALVDNGLFTWQDINKSSVGLNAANTVIKKLLSGLYHQEAGKKTGETS